MKRNFVVRKEAAHARFVPLRVVEPNFRHETWPGFPRNVRAVINAQIQLNSIIRGPIESPRDDYIYGYNAGKRHFAKEYATVAFLSALKKADSDSMQRIAKKFGLTSKEVEEHLMSFSAAQRNLLQDERQIAKSREERPMFISEEIKESDKHTTLLIDELGRMGHLIIEEGADRLEAFGAYCRVLVNNILNPDSS